METAYVTAVMATIVAVETGGRGYASIWQSLFIEDDRSPAVAVLL